MWKVKSIVQFPRRYKTQEPSYPAIARLGVEFTQPQ